MPPPGNSVTYQPQILRKCYFWCFILYNRKGIFLKKVLWGCPVGMPFLWGQGRILVSKASQFSDKRLQVLYAFNNWFYFLCKFSISIKVTIHINSWSLKPEQITIDTLTAVHFFSIFDTFRFDKFWPQIRIWWECCCFYDLWKILKWRTKQWIYWDSKLKRSTK